MKSVLKRCVEIIGIFVALSVSALLVTNAANRKHSAVESIERAGGTVKFFEDSVSRSTSFSVMLRERCGIDMRSRVYQVSIRDTRVTERDWQALKYFDKLTGIDLHGCELTTEQFLSLSAMKQLIMLDVSDTNVSEYSLLALIPKLPRLAAIDLRGTSIARSTVEDLKHQYPNLTIWEDEE